MGEIPAPADAVRVISDERYRWGSNFWPCVVPMGSQVNAPWTLDDGIIFRSSEHAYQWHKHDDHRFRKRVVEASTPFQAKKEGSRDGMAAYGLQIISEWDLGVPPYKVRVMLKVVRAKYKFNPVLAKLLLATGDRPIVEDSPWDDFWGLGKTGNGLNWLGKTTMLVRKELRSGKLKIYTGA